MRSQVKMQNVIGSSVWVFFSVLSSVHSRIKIISDFYIGVCYLPRKSDLHISLKGMRLRLSHSNCIWPFNRLSLLEMMFLPILNLLVSTKWVLPFRALNVWFVNKSSQSWLWLLELYNLCKRTECEYFMYCMGVALLFVVWR